MIAFRDFVPQIKSRSMLGIVAEYEYLSETLDRANQWIARHDVRVLNVETLFVGTHLIDRDGAMPKLAGPGAPGSAEVQVIRVWYQG
jgi:hypothetical protein